MKSSILFILLCITSVVVIGQTKTTTQAVLTIDEFTSLVKTFHPVAKQAELRLENAEGYERASRGAFDPKIEANLDEKFYQEKSYYSTTNAVLKLPTRSPLTLKAGYDLNNGTFLDPSESTPDDGLLAAGVSFPILQGLLTDERRTTLRISQAFNEFSQAERKSIYNDLMFEAYGAYWNWYASYQKRKVADEMLTIAAVRFDAIKQRALAGDRPFIDTVEAFLQVQLRTQQVFDAATVEVKSRFFLSGFLWYDDENASLPTGMIISETTIPELPTGIPPTELATINRTDLLQVIYEQHPEILAYNAKLDQLEAEARWKREKLKPKLDLEYNVLSTGAVSTEDATFSTRNYKWGLSFAFPIFLREARGELQMQKVKILDNQYLQDIKAMSLATKANAAFINWGNINTQLTVARNNVTNYSTLLEAERTRFFNGESSLFLVNAREMALADARNKLVDLEAKLEMASVEVRYLLGRLGQ